MVAKVEIREDYSSSPTTIKNSIKTFRSYLSYAGKSEHTITTYINGMKAFQEFVDIELNKKVNYVSNLRQPYLTNYVIFLRKEVEKGNVKPATANLRINSLRVYLNYIIEEMDCDVALKKPLKVVDKTYFKKINPRKNSEKSKEILTKNQILTLLNTISSSNSINKYRDIAIIHVLYATGCRKSELLNLRWQDIDINKNTIHIFRTKNMTENILPVSSDVIATLLNHKNSGNNKVTDYVFPQEKNREKHLSESALQYTLKKWVSKSGITFSVSAHSFRHTFINHNIESGVNNEHIAIYTGHRDGSSLKEYVSKSTSRLKNVTKAVSLSGLSESY